MREKRTRITLARLVAIVAVLAALAALALPVAAQNQSATVALNELNGSGVSGSAVLTAQSDMTKVDITVQGAAGGEPAAIHKGTCDNLDPTPLFQLNALDASGKSTTTINVTLSALLSGQYALSVSKSNSQIGVYVACGNIASATGGTTATTAATAAAASAATQTTTTTTTGTTTTAAGGTTSVTTAPSTGAGSAAGGSNDTLLVAGLGLLALVLAGGGVALRRRESRG